MRGEFSDTGDRKEILFKSDLSVHPTNKKSPDADASGLWAERNVFTFSS